MNSIYDVRKVQLCEMEILHKVHDICQENNIKYFLAYGTALGAVRHGGFIPWDDDIDIGMTRENYNKFIEIAPKFLGEDFFLQTKFTEKHTPYIYAKVRKNNTIFMEWNKRNLNINHGVYIDIFPYDRLPDDEILRSNLAKKYNFFYRMFLYKIVPDRDKQSDTKIGWFVIQFIRRMIHYFLYVIPKSYLYNKLELLSNLYNNFNTEYFSSIVANDSKSKIKAYDIENLTKIKFEDMETFVPSNVDICLRDSYGDYMKLPPENERIGHIPYKVEI